MSNAFTIQQFSSHIYESLIPGRLDDNTPGLPARWDIRQDAIALRRRTEIAYEIAPNTSLINVTGSVSNESMSCYARLEPEPWWWKMICHWHIHESRHTEKTRPFL